MKTKEPSEEFRAQVSDYVPKKRKRPWSLPPVAGTPVNIQDSSQAQNLGTPNHINSLGNESVLSENQNTGNSSPPTSDSKMSEGTLSDNQITEKQITKFQSSEIQSAIFQTSINKLSDKQSTTNQSSEIKPSDNQMAEIQITKFQLTEKPLAQRPTKKPRLQNSQSESAKVGELGISYGGFMPLSCLILDQSIFGELRPGEFKLYIYLLFLAFRYPERKNHVRAAIAYLVAGTGIKKDAVIAHMKRLNELNLAKCVEHNQKIGNLYSVSTTYLWNTSKVLSENQNTENKNTDKTHANSGFSDGSTLENHTPHSENQTQDKTYLENKSLLKNEEPIFIQNYFSVLPQAKLKKEREAFLSLKMNYSEGDIEACFSYLQAHGELKTGTPCHSPLSYLSMAINDVLKKIRENDKRSRVGDQSQTFLEENRQKEIERKREEDFKMRENAFTGAFPSQESQMEQIEKIIEKLPMKVSGELGRRIAITTWWNNEGGNGSG